MEEVLVQFETAILAKEKGFDFINVHNYYHINEGYSKGYAFCYSEVNKQTNECLLTPTQSLLQKWLREEHNIHIEINYGKDKTNVWFNPNIYSLIKPQDGDNWDYYNDLYTELVELYPYDTYEKALEVGLQEALKLI